MPRAGLLRLIALFDLIDALLDEVDPLIALNDGLKCKIKHQNINIHVKCNYSAFISNKLNRVKPPPLDEPKNNLFKRPLPLDEAQILNYLIINRPPPPDEIFQKVYVCFIF